MLGALERLVRPGAVVYDIGANIGLYSRFMMQIFQASRVYAFEPSSRDRELLVKNVKLAGYTNQVSVLDIAISDEDGLAEFQVDDLSSQTGVLDAVTRGAASENRRQYRLSPIKETVRVCKLDSVIRELRLSQPDVIKMDIEGAEAMALEGSRQLLSERALSLAIELHSAAVTKQVLQILWECHYHCFGYLETPAGDFYQELASSDLPWIAGKYSLRFLAASTNQSELTQPIERQRWS